LTFDGEHHHFFAYLRASQSEVNGMFSQSPLIFERVLWVYRCFMGPADLLESCVYACLQTGMVVFMFWPAVFPAIIFEFLYG